MRVAFPDPALAIAVPLLVIHLKVRLLRSHRCVWLVVACCERTTFSRFKYGIYVTPVDTQENAHELFRFRPPLKMNRLLYSSRSCRPGETTTKMQSLNMSSWQNIELPSNQFPYKSLLPRWHGVSIWKV